MRILVVDDEEDLVDLVAYNLEAAGFETAQALTGHEALRAAAEVRPDLVVLDVMLPDLQGFEVLRILRSRDATREVPVILLTARGGEPDRLAGFELGADDYVVKPFSPRELVARVRAVLKRAANPEAGARPIRHGELEIDPGARRVWRGGQEVELAPQEYRLLEFLASHPNRVYSREALLQHAWDPDVVVDPRTVDVHVRRLRARLEPDPTRPRWIETVRGAGYRFNPRG
ncbi:winged helix-turn-helix domain-containing protein [Deferrisoma camini]|uniref:winged helix-turn-helix domain-containing protein n=1 Tax=Deferrisoma camini TaxID=1035120 RepID=UPI00046CEF5C|nr:response regulator transcription factor [Deferrisoma camini]